MTPVTLFSYITPEEQERMRICFDMHEAVYRNNETVMEYSSSMKKIGLILEGQAVLYCIDEDGNQYMIDNLKKDSVFGEPFLLPEESQHYYVCAKSETRVLFIAYEHVIKRCENACKFHSQLVSNLLQMIALRASQQASRIYVLSRNSVRKKIIYPTLFSIQNPQFLPIPFYNPLICQVLQLPHHGAAVYTEVFSKGGVGHGQDNSFRLFFCSDGI